MWVLYHFLRFSRFVRRHGLIGLWKSVLGSIVAQVQKVPGLSSAMDEQINKELDDIRHHMLGDGDPNAFVILPQKGRSRTEVMDFVKNKLSTDIEEYQTRKKWAGVYHDVGTSDLTELQSDMFRLYNSTNSLYPEVFPSVRKFEAEIVSMCISLLHGHEHGAVGLLSSGGTESILIAMFSYREMAYKRGIQDPEIICCYSAHPAVDKACHYFGIKLVKVKADVNQQLRSHAVAPVITRNTIAIFSSAPTFPHGVVDPIEELAKLAKDRNIGLHVDNCLGGFYLTFMERAGLFKKKWDFQVPGVTTISIDVHKYGYASKGVSVVAFSSKDLRQLAYHPVTDGMTLYVTPTLQGSRSGAVIASAWSTLLHKGEEGYLKEVKKLDAIFQKIKMTVKNIPDIDLLVDSDLAIIPVTSKKLNIYKVSTLMEQRGWNMFTCRSPPCMSICVGAQHEHILEVLLDDLQNCVAEVRRNPDIEVGGTSKVYGAATLLPDNIIDHLLRSYMDIKMTVKPAHSE